MPAVNLGGRIVPVDFAFGRWSGGRYIAVKQGDVFHAMHVKDEGEGGWELAAQTWGYVYGPVHSSITFDDVEGARHAWKDDDGFYHFSHATPAEHLEFADYCESQALLAIQPILNEETEKFMASTGPIAAQARGRFQSWRAFAVEVQKHARTYALAEPLGHWERNRDLHHARNVVGRAMSATLNEWGASGVGTEDWRNYQAVRSVALMMALSRQQAPTETIKTWPAHRAALAAAEAAKKKAEAETREDTED